MSSDEKNEIIEVLNRIELKNKEICSLLKDGKIIVAYEKLFGITKVISQLSMRVKTLENTENGK